MPFVLERAKESSVPDLIDNLHSDSARHINSAQRQNLRRQIARLRAIDRRPQVQRLHAYRARFRQTLLRDLWRRIGVRIFKAGVLHLWRQKLMKRAKSASGQNQFTTYLRIPAPHEAQQLNLLLRVRRKIGMTALRWHDPVARAA